MALVLLVGRGFGWLGRALLSLMRRSRIAFAAVIVVATLMVGGLVDFGLNAGRVYPGVHVGTVDVSGKTSDEIVELLDREYGTRLATGSATVYANDKAAEAALDGSLPLENRTLGDQGTVDEERRTTSSWTVKASSLSAALPTSELAGQAIAVGREDGGLLARLTATFGGWTVDVHAQYAEDPLETLASNIDAVIGEKRVDFGIDVTDGVATVSPGHDGDMVNRTTLSHELDDAFLHAVDGTGSFTVYAEYAPVRIDADMAQKTCDDVNAAIANGACFIYGDASWGVDAKEIGTWVVGRVEEHDGSFALVPSLDVAKAKPSIALFAKDRPDSENLRVSFSVEPDDTVFVHAEGIDSIFLADDTVSTLDAALFGSDGKAAQVRAAVDDGNGGEGIASEPVEVPLVKSPLPENLTFDEALDAGVVEPISTYTTEFTTGAGTKNRNRNIDLVSQLLNNSLVGSNDSWSFNETAGDCDAERGFLGAGAIVDGVYDDAVGGGICQVATTVFNAVYEAGFPVKTRHSHSLYIPSYPTGRDAAVSWPDLDLVWENDSENAVLMRVTCANSSVTATLYSVDPGYQVSTQVGDWQEGEKHKTETERDESLKPGTSYVKTRGTDGRKISLVRTVKDRAGTVLHQDLFASEYDPITEVVVEGPKTTSEDADPASSSDADRTQKASG